MIKPFLAACLALLSVAAQAAPIPFFDIQLDVTAIATTVDGTPGFNTQSSGGADILVSVDSLGAADIATAGAFAGAGLLSTTADLSSVSGGISSAVSTARFVGSFLGGGLFSFGLDFTATNFASGTGLGASSLFVSLVSDGAVVFEDFVSGPWTFSFLSGVGSTNVLDLTLTSETSAGFPGAGQGGAFSSGLVVLTTAVPAPASWLLTLLGLSLLAVHHRRRVHGTH